MRGVCTYITCQTSASEYRKLNKKNTDHLLTVKRLQYFKEILMNETVGLMIEYLDIKDSTVSKDVEDSPKGRMQNDVHHFHIPRYFDRLLRTR